MKRIIVICILVACGLSLHGQNITAIEYYVDTDPGFGSGTAVTITPAATITNLTFNINVNAMSDGFHTLFVRAKDANNRWSLPVRTPFYKISAASVAPAPNINKIEYFFDTDPGFGLATDVPVTPATTINNQNIAIPLTSASDGFHNLYIRTRDANNMWSLPVKSPFYKISAASVAPAPNINKIEYFFDTDPGFGSGTDVPVTPATTITNQAIAIPLTSASDGFHNLFIRTRDANNKWSLVRSTPFYKISASVGAPATNINKVEYFIDADPGYGSGVNVAITPALTINNISLNIALGAVSVGNHILTVRARDLNNNWSIVAIKNFSVCNHPGTTVGAATAITSSGFNISWADVPGSINYQLDVSTDNFATFVSGYQAKVITAPSTSTTVTGLSQATAYQYRVRAVASCASVESNTGTVSTLATPPSAQPTNLLFTSVTATTLTAFFTAASPAPTGYLVVRKAASNPTFVPSNNTTYTVGQTVGDGIVVHNTSAILFNESGLTANTRYYYKVYSFNQASGSTTYLTTSPLENNVITVATEPTAQPTNLQFTSVTEASFQVSFTAAAGTPNGYIVLRKVGSAPTSVPADGTTYTTTVGSDDVVHNGAATSFAQNGLSQNTQYYYAVYAYNGSGTSINYRTTSPLQGNQVTPIAPPASPTNLVFSNVTPTSMTVAFTAPAQAPSGYLVVRKVGGNPSFTPQINTSYTLGQSLSDGVVAYVGSSTSFDQTGLTASTTYFYDVFAFNQQSSLVSYQVTAALEGSKSTFTAEPTTQPTGMTVTEPSVLSLKITYTAASPAPSGYIVLRKTGSAPDVTPADGTSYNAGETIGDVTVAFAGNALTFTDNSLSSGTSYFYRAFSFNGSGTSTNYLVSAGASNSGSGLTIPAKPATPTASVVAQTSFKANWTAVTGASSYRLDVSKDNFVTMVTGFDDVTVNGTSTDVTALETGMAYKFRLRAVNASGTSVNSDAAQQFTIPSTPVLATSSDVTQTSFTAKWNASAGAAEYFIDISTDHFSTFVTGYQNKSITGATSAAITGLTAGSTYHYRVRSMNAGGTSPSSSEGTQLLIPATPVGIDAADRSSTSFKAKWLPAAGATEYRLDVTLTANNFNPSLPAYTDIAVTENTEEVISNLAVSTAYRYRVRAVNSSGTSPSSAPISVSTTEPSTGFELGVGFGVFNEVFTGTPVEITAVVQGGTPPYKVTLFHKKIMTNAYSTRPVTTVGFKTPIETSMLDELGIEFYFQVEDAKETKKASEVEYMYRSVPTAGATIPFSKSGGVAQSYEIFSIPYQVNDNLVGSIFEELGEVDKSKWRLIRYQGGKNTDLGLVGRIEPGKGYWFNRKDNVNIQFSGGTVTKGNTAEPFVLQLEKGWNQVGNPYPFDVRWADVLDANKDVPGIGNLHVFNPSGFHLNDESSVLKTWGGGFIHNANDGTVSLKFPVTLKSGSGRLAGGQRFGSRLDAPVWMVPISIKQGELMNATASIGMHDEASVSVDKFDDFVVPRFLNYLEFYTEHEEFFSPQFSSDVVPKANSYNWKFNFESSNGEKATLEWDNSGFGASEAQLFLLDVNHNLLINMRTDRSYSFSPEKGQSFRIFYGRNSEDIMPDITSVGNPWPTPFRDRVNIPFIVEREGAFVEAYVIDAMGNSIRTLTTKNYRRGMHSVNWEGVNHLNDEVSAGMYIIRVKIDGVSMFARTIKY